MYKKDLSESIRVRVSYSDLQYLIALSESMHCSVSSVLRTLILRSKLSATMEDSKDGHAKAHIDDIV